MTETLRIPGDVAERMVTHCLQERPNEACGLLASDGAAVVHVFALSNASQSPVRYSLDPKEQFEAYKEIEGKGWQLGGIFHSHTRTEAYPSPTDVRLAAEDVPYVIVSLASEPPSIRAYRITKENWTDDRGEISELIVEVDRTSSSGKGPRV